MLKKIINFTLFLAALFTIGAAGSSIYNEYYLPQNELTLKLINDTSVISEKKEIHDLEIRYKDKLITNLTKQEFQLINSGREQILDQDVSKKVTLQFDKKSAILSVQITSASEKFLKEDSKVVFIEKDNKIILTFKDIQPDEILVFDVFIDGETSTTPIATARAKNMPSLKTNYTPQEKGFKELLKGKSLWVLSGILIFTMFASLILEIVFSIVRIKFHKIFPYSAENTNNADNPEEAKKERPSFL